MAAPIYYGLRILMGAILLQRNTSFFGGSVSLLASPSVEDYVTADKVQHFYSIDFLRGVAAVIVLIWHYQHFFMGGALPHGSPLPGMLGLRSDQPLYWLLWPFYEHGFWAVQAFWIISGFVFAHRYASRETRGSEFFIARFTRLYPLHLITLVAVAVGQFLSKKLTGGFQIVSYNDLYHFFLNVFFVNGWGFEMGHNFNTPSWSVSVELAIYAAFFLLGRRIFAFGLVIPLLFMGLGGAVMNQGTPIWTFGLCTFFFFEGVIVYYVVLRLRDRPSILIAGSAASIVFFSYVCLAGRLERFEFYNIESYLFVPIIVIASSLDLKGKGERLFQKVKWLGDATYSTYMWHFPIQILILALFQYFGIGAHVFRSPIFLVVWIGGMIWLSVQSYQKIEMPLQKLSKTKIKEGLSLPNRT